MFRDHASRKGRIGVDNPGLEQMTALGLLAVGSLTAFGIMVAGRRWRLSRSSRQIDHGWADAPVPIPKLPSPTTSQELGGLLESSGDWVHRRVESVEFIDVKTIRRRVSVDFTLPLPSNNSPLGHAPIALLRKGVLTRFDLRDEEGRSLPLLTASQNAGFATQYMLSLARRTNSGTAPARLLELCWKIARADAKDGMVALSELKRDPTLAPLRSDALEIAARTFAGNFMVIVPIQDTKRRRIIKFAYDELVSGEPSGLARFGLVAATFMIYLSDLGNAGSRHLEFLRADGLEIFDAAILGRTPAGESLGPWASHARQDRRGASLHRRGAAEHLGHSRRSAATPARGDSGRGAIARRACRGSPDGGLVFPARPSR
jgi:hypothetical protein